MAIPRGSCVLLVLLLLARPALAGQAESVPDVITRDAAGTTIRAVRVTWPMAIDGALDEPLYAVPPMSGFVQVEPESCSSSTTTSAIPGCRGFPTWRRARSSSR
ncbi:MAG: hypothetical protein FJW14_08990 [Acidimicrobiia bacterium]|nr:hypothetical protein [Acidimicrobiia bacterium]